MTQTLINLFKTIFLVDLLKGLWVTLKYTPQPAFTFQYPAERRPTAPRFRGVLRLQTEPGTGAQTCIVCDQCAKACPDDLIALAATASRARRSKSSITLTSICRAAASAGYARKCVPPSRLRR